MISFTVYGEPKGKGRPRFRRMGNFVQTYSSEVTINYENLVKMSFIENCQERYLDSQPLDVDIVIYQSIPSSTSKKKQKEMEEGNLRPTKKPDCDNIIKAILDGLNKVAYKDDTQIVKLSCEKFYSNEPRVEILIKELER
jgi:Holliday junction resolvase RusA-like endonuclease